MERIIRSLSSRGGAMMNADRVKSFVRSIRVFLARTYDPSVEKSRTFPKVSFGSQTHQFCSAPVPPSTDEGMAASVPPVFKSHFSM